jgi:serine/threonine protein kinase
MGNALPTTAVNVDAGDWTTAYNRQTKTLQLERSAMRLKIGHDTDMDTDHASIRKEGNEITSVNDFAVVKGLGKGAFGEVFLSSRKGDLYAVKVLKKSALKRMRQGRTGSALDTVKTEIATMKKISHPNCVQMFDVILDPDQDEVFLVLEYVDGGSSQSKGADGKPQRLPHRTIWSHLRHLVMGLEYLHMNQIVHRDIKPDNLLVTRPGKMYPGDAGILKIADFGTSCFCEGDANAQKTAGSCPCSLRSPRALSAAECC